MMVIIIISMVIIGTMAYGISLSEKGYRGPMSRHFDGRKFLNPNGIKGTGFWNVLKWSFTRKKGVWKADYTDYAPKGKILDAHDHEVRILFVNHSTFLIQMNGINILIDPVWSKRASPLSWAGPKRLRQPGIHFNSLPKIDLVLLTHNHYDHLDIETLKVIDKVHSPEYIVPLGVDKILERLNILNVRQLDWHQHAIFGKIKITATPAIHFSGRGMLDRDNTLWCGFIINGLKSLYIVGDTAYDDQLFKDIRNKYSSIDISIIPIGAYKPKWFMSPIHTDPNEAVRIHQDIGSNESIACHFGTFQLADEGLDDVPQDLNKALGSSGVSPQSFILPKEGEFYIY
ncbi:MBL fold metallo-hydrolase [Pedobacter agri]|uniref:MBL fold metallo-hydrolase n=1 Tax=Pedobacter agri TaxID=454586 RepID=UPI002931DDED|nr:MBL fold metallo-hydrolase [Pedobacter agri]